MNKDELFLIYVNLMGKDHKDNYVYEFIFSDKKKDIDGDEWDSYPASGKPSPPHNIFIKAVGKLVAEDLRFDVIQENEQFAVWDAVDGLIALAWENVDDYETYPEKRTILQFGLTMRVVEDILYERDLTLKYNKPKNESE